MMKVSPQNPWFIWLLILLLFLFSTAYITYYCSHFNFPKIIILYHLGLVTIIYFTFIIGAIFWTQLTYQKSKILGWIPALALGVIFLFFVQLYVLNIVSLDHWGENINLKIITTALTDLPALIEALPFEPISLVVMIVGLPLAIMISFFLLRNKLQASFLANYQSWKFAKYRNSLSIGFLMISITGLSILAWKNKSIRGVMKYKGEPSYNFFSPAGPSFENNHVDLKEVKQIQEQRTLYQNIKEVSNKNVILIIADAMRSDHMSLFGYDRNTTPYLDSLDATGQLSKVDYAVANCSSSFCGILNVLSSKIVSDLSCGNYKVQDVFADLGYQTNFLLVGSHIEWYQLKRYYDFHKKIDFFKEGPYTQKYTPTDDRVVLEFLDELGPQNKQGQFFYIHLLSSHNSGVKYPGFQKFQPAEKTNFFNPDSITMYNYYDNGIVQVDDMLRQILEKMDQLGYMEDALVIITADHGEAVGEHGRFAHGGNIYNENTNIPILFLDTQGASVNANQFASQLDIAPMILNHLDIPRPPFWDGDLEGEEAVKYVYQQQRDHYGIIQYRPNQILKYVYDDKTQKEELFDVTTDRIEKTNLILDPNFKEELSRLKAKFSEVFLVN